MTFSFGNENEQTAVSPEIVKEMFEDYAGYTGIEFVAGDKKHGEEAYFEDLVDRATRGGSGRNQKNIDLVIVANQLLTGYDSKRLNTLYVDRTLELHELIQAYSRTNRVFGPTKEFGTIINFQYPAITKEAVDTELVPGKLTNDLSFDEAFDLWRLTCIHNCVEKFANEWGVDVVLLEKAVQGYSVSQPDVVPYIEEIIASIDFNKINNQSTGNLLMYSIKLTDELPVWIAELKRKYD